jgi:hypothetical protein
MSELLRLLAMYYACDNTATQRMLSQSEIAMCIERYNAVKAYFSGATDDPLEGYRQFKVWERKNGDLVVQLRARRSL